MSSPSLSRLLERLEWPVDPVDLVLDTDTFNEIDDQFALVYALLAPDRINLRAVHAAPFHNQRSSGPGDGMEKSYEEILRVLERMGRPAEGLVFRGSREWLPDAGSSVASPARDHLIELARSRTDRPLYVAAIGAITNVAAALVAAPDIADRIVVLWLAGQPLDWPTAREFNLRGDCVASRVVFDSGVPLVLFPCANVTEALRTTLAEMARFVKGKGAIGDYLYQIFESYEHDLTGVGASKVIWDIVVIGWLIRAEWASTVLVPSPILTSDCTYSVDRRRHPIRVATQVSRDGIFGDLFRRLETARGER